MTPATRQLIASLDVQWHEFYSERAAILEEGCNLSRDEAEQMAWMVTAAAMLKSRVAEQDGIPKPMASPRHEIG